MRSTTYFSHIRGRARRRRARARRWAAIAFAVPLLVSAGVVGALRFLDPPSSAFMLGYRLFEERRAPALLHRWVDYEQIAWAAKIAVVAAEDQRFKDHVGFDVNEISASLADARHRGRLRGASTLSQQVAKNLFLWPESTWARKGLEAYFTVLLELLWDKRRILEVYLNVAELGPGVYGVEAAAERYFHKRASELDRAEAALLAAVLPSPRRLRVDAPSDYVRERQAWILGQMDRLGGQRYLAEIE